MEHRRLNIAKVAWAVLFSCFCYSLDLRGQCVMQKLPESSTDSGGHFGKSVDIDGQVAVIGNPMEGCNVPNMCGAVRVYRWLGKTWVEDEVQRIGGQTSEAFLGWSSAISGNVIVAGSPGQGCTLGLNCGAAIVYRYNGAYWAHEQKLRAFVLAPENLVGRSVAVSGDVALLGAPGEECEAGVDCGAAYLYRFLAIHWYPEQKFVGIDPAAYDEFGRAVAVDGDVAVVGARGATFVYRFNGAVWTTEQELIPSGSRGTDFGRPVAVRGNRIVVGTGAEATVFRFVGSAWEEEQTLTPSDPVRAYDSFGGSISIDGNSIVVGALRFSYGGTAYLYRFSGLNWVEERKLTSGSQDSFGYSVAVSGDMAVVGAPYANRGAAWMFALGPDCNDNGEADFCDIRDGDRDDDNDDGVPDECQVFPVSLDIRPGACPNPFNPQSRGVISVALVGDSVFDVAEIESGSILLTRSDGIGGGVRPLSGSPGLAGRSADVITSLDLPACACLPQGPDGYDDLILKFSPSELTERLNLDAPVPSGSLMLTLSGLLADGTRFAGSDCIRFVGSSVSPAPVEFGGQLEEPTNGAARSRKGDLPLGVDGRASPKE